MKQFTAIVHRGEPDEGGFWATCLEVPGANGQGETRAECLADLKAAIQLMLDIQREEAFRLDPNAETEELSNIDLTLDRKAYQIALGTFSFMRDHWNTPGIVDPAALLISQQDAADLVAKLKAGDHGGAQVTIPMNFNDWVVYGALLSHASSNIPQSDPHAAAVLEALWDDLNRRDDTGEAPQGS
jgi:predicted RNase H-like HicB family nuclease